MNKELTRPQTAATERVSAENGRAAVRPRVDVFENEAEYLVVADMPGVAMDSVNVGFDNGQLQIEASREWKTPGTPLAEEYRALDFRRAFAMPDGIDADKIAAKLARGVLTIHLPKAPSRRARKIEVRSS